MKRLILVVALCAIVAAFTGCSNNGSPRAVVEKSYKCLYKGDAKGFANCYYFYKDLEENREQLAGMMQSVLDALEQEGKSHIFEDYEFVDEEVDEEAGTATETFRVTNAEGKTITDESRLEKHDGKWYIIYR